MCAASTSAANTSSEEDPERAYKNCNNFFNPNICHVCKSTIIRIVCKCNMICYCSKYHQQKYENQHMDMCKSLQRIQYIYKARFNITLRFNQEEWIKTRKELKTYVRSRLARDLVPYEKQMILFARSCLICHQQIDLSPCLRCYSSNYCDEHREAFQNQHYFN
ncbi:uncharacterized protein LOC116846874 [Odontomachus brunneus]|uniref:uncharacterized protein LOC116846874 n=1 Tax=Odontomachus brunneus TaxID=486640 RepID=UPI0013F2A0E7|nr:uncharacterized protein LOC116846874 [Odontomachus brunneus]